MLRQQSELFKNIDKTSLVKNKKNTMENNFKH